MREILFRAKKSEYDGWAEGYFVSLVDAYKGRVSYRIYTGEAETDCGEFYPDWFEVDHMTVGQYTGLKDRNGTKIFEGDVIRYTARGFDGKNFSVAAAVEFHEGGFGVCDYSLNNWLYDGANGNVDLSGVEVIGNVHDNPELTDTKSED